jgi:hypothetical protein
MPFSPNFLVIDTEGKKELKEIAVIDRDGRVIYEGYGEK